LDLHLQTKAQAFVLLDSFETDLRRCFRDFVLDHMSTKEALGGAYDSVMSIVPADEPADAIDLSGYLYLRQVYDLLLHFKIDIPRDLGDELSSNVGSLDSLVSLRNRVMHGRPLHMDDLESVAGIISRFSSRHFAASRLTKERLAAEPLWDPPYAPEVMYADRVLNNLPMADYDETGLVGRGGERVAIRELLEKRRDRIITVTGEGGIGKTALALEIAYGIVDDPEGSFDCVLWVSLKNEILTADGVKALTGAVKDIAGASSVMGQVFDDSFGGSITELAEYLEGLNTLIIIDNLETAQGTEVLELYDALPVTTSFLFTSRVGLGQVERRYPLAGLDPHYASILFRKFASRRQLASLAALPQQNLTETLNALRYSPLAIRWYILSVESGKAPSDTLRNQEQLLRFCVDNVYEALEPSAKLLLVILRSLDRPISFDELVVLAELPIDELRASSQALARGSLVVRLPPAEPEESERVQISATARAYLPRVDYESPMLQGVASREAAYVSDRERQQLESQARRLDANMIHVRGPQDQPTAHLLRMALRLAKNGDYEAADTQIAKARSLNAEYFEVDRVSAFIYASQKDLYRADQAYRTALSAARSAHDKAVVKFFFAGFLGRLQHDLDGAIRYAQEAHETLQYHDTALELGNVLVWKQRFAEGQEYLEFALDAPGSKMKRIATTSIVESWRRWAELSADSKNFTEAFERALAGVNIGMKTLKGGTQDLRLARSVIASLREAIRAYERAANRELLDTKRLASNIRSVGEWIVLFRTVPGWVQFYDTATRAAGTLGPGDPILDAIGSIVRASTDRSVVDSMASVQSPESVILKGHVKAIRDTFGFIRHPKHPDDIFFHKGSVSSGVWSDLLVDTAVTFELELGENGKYRANNVATV
jgi:Tfp pilus assembly protein PilF/cold shock CspA family protein